MLVVLDTNVLLSAFIPRISTRRRITINDLRGMHSKFHPREQIEEGATK
jgi:hypothetical protein